MIVPEDDAGGESRRAGIGIVLMILRMMEHVRRTAGDYNSAMVLLAVIAISSEKFTRGGIQEELRTLETPVDRDELLPCNVTSIALATGFNRETTRRYVNRLIEHGTLERMPSGAIAFAPGFMQSKEIAELLRTQLEVVSRTTNDLLRLGALKLVRSQGDQPVKL